MRELLWTLPAAVIWGGIWWRLRGGAFTALTGIRPGTGGMRAIAGIGMGAPMAICSWHYAAMMPALSIVWSLAGWGAFQSMGSSPIEEKNPVASTLERMGVTNPTANDLLGMGVEGVFIMLLLSLVPALITHDWTLYPLFALSGVMFSPLYFIPQRLISFPSLRNFAVAGQEWGEVLVGAWVGFALVLFEKVAA